MVSAADRSPLCQRIRDRIEVYRRAVSRIGYDAAVSGTTGVEQRRNDEITKLRDDVLALVAAAFPEATASPRTTGPLSLEELRQAKEQSMLKARKKGSR